MLFTKLRQCLLDTYNCYPQDVIKFVGVNSCIAFQEQYLLSALNNKPCIHPIFKIQGVRITNLLLITDLENYVWA